MNNCKVTVVVPIYNVEKFLKRCIDSIINQTMKELEIILVDDGATDNSGKICDEYAKIDNRIKVIHQSNAGLSAARNSGIKIASAEYICFIDSDDYIEKDMIEYLYNGAQKYNSDIACCGFSNIYENGLIEKVTIPTDEICYSNEEALNIHLFSGYIDVVAWNKLYKLNLFKDILYPEGYLYEDMLTTYKLLAKSEKISLHPDSKYFYCKRKTSIGGANFSEKTLKLLDACDECVDFVLEKKSNLKDIKIAKIQWYIVVLNKMILSNVVEMKLLKQIRKLIRKNMINIIKNNYLSSTRKIQILLLLFPKIIYEKLYINFILKNR